MRSRLRSYQMRTVLRSSPRGTAAMKTHHKVVLGIFVLIMAIAVCAPVVDRWTEMRAKRAAVLDFQYREMTNALVFGALEHRTEHPMNRLYHERRDALVKAGYLKKREFPMRQGFESSRAAQAFFWRFASRFPGTEFQLRGAKPPATPMVVAYARDSDLLA